MEHIRLATYLKNNPQSKRLNKRFARALKTYLHSVKDLRHAAADINHSKEDCVFAILSANQFIEDCHGVIEEWVLSKDPDQQQNDSHLDLAGQDVAKEQGGDKCNSETLGQVEEHLRHAAKDIGHALHDANSALRDLTKVDEYLSDIIEMAENEGYAIKISDAKACLLQAASESESAKVVATDTGETSDNS